MMPFTSFGARRALCLTLLLAATGAAFAQPSSRVLFGLTNTWRYNQTTSFDGVNWTAPGFDDSALPAGRGVLALEDANNPFVTSRTNTVLTIGRITYYFRTTFVFTNTPGGVSLTFSNIVDDGAVFYLNGREIQRLYMPAAPAAINYGTIASNHEATGFDVFTLSGPIIDTNLVAGTNVLAVEVHQSSTGSSDIVWGCALTAHIPDPNPPPTLRMPAEPPRYGFTFVPAFPGVNLAGPMAIAAPPGETNRLYFAERGGRVSAITNLAAPNRTVVMDISSRVTQGCEEGLLGLAFHPGFATNRYFFVFYSTIATTETPGGTNVLHQRISRFTANEAGNGVVPNSELVLITQRDEQCNHNGGDIHFGPDGYLYIAVGDEGLQNDQLNNSQTIRKDFFSGILRIDVDKLPGNLPPNPHPSLGNATNYFVPADNPWINNSFPGDVNASGTLRTEFYAVGLRNPWRFSFDPATGLLWCGDVGGALREEVDIIVKGGNYGWAFREGFIAGPKPNTGASVINPIHDYPHGTSGTNVGNSITGGIVYHGDGIPELRGAYIFADFTSPGNVWALRYNGTNVTRVQWLLQEGGIATFGRDPRNGDVLVGDTGDGGVVKRLVYDTNNLTGATLPPTLADTGAFTNLTTITNGTQALTANAGVHAYDLNAPFWSDGAHKTRWYFMPTNGAKVGFEAEGHWSLPTGMAWVKHFDLEMTNGVPESARRIETRILVRNSNGTYGVTYRWGDSMTNATLVGENGLHETFTIYEGGSARTQVWRYPSRAECASCHTAVGGWALGFNTLQLNRERDGTNQLGTLAARGHLTNLVSEVQSLRALAPLDDENASREWRLRSYLTANCAQCHQPGGSGLGHWNASITNFTAHAGLIDGAVVNGGGNADARVIAPWSLANSLLLSRIATRGPGQMPPLASTVLDTQAIALVSAWITNDLAQGWSNDIAPLHAVAVATNGGVTVQFTQPPNRATRVESATTLDAPVPWQFLNVPENAPKYPAASNAVSIFDPTNAAQKFYRVRVSTP